MNPRTPLRPRRPGPQVCRLPRRASRSGPLAAFLVLVLGAGCAGGGTGGARPVAPVADLPAFTGALEETTALDGPTVVIFDWSLAEEGLRLSGRGAARVEPPSRARLDLFLANGEPAAQAVLVDQSLRTPYELPGGLLPPAPLLWATLGIYREFPDTEVLGAEELEDGGRLLRVALDPGPDGSGDEEVHYRFRGDRMVWAGWLRNGDVIRQVQLEHDGDHLPSRAVYRDLPAYRELILTRTSFENVASFPSDIWHP